MSGRYENHGCKFKKLNASTTQVGLFNYADAYIRAAILLRRAERKTPFFEVPVKFLLFHSIELYLKSFLRGTGLDASVLAGFDFGHNLSKLIAESQVRNLQLNPIDVKRLNSAQDDRLPIIQRYIDISSQTNEISLNELIEVARNVRNAAKRTFPITDANGREPVWIAAMSAELENFLNPAPTGAIDG